MAITDSNATDTDRTRDDVILRVEDATITFDMDRGRSRVLDSVSLDIRNGEILGVVGESGSGKSMFASALLDAVVEPGLLQGEITYFAASGNEVDVLDLGNRDLKQFRWEEIAMVFQGAMSSFNPTLSITGHFRETLEAHDYDVEGGIDRAREIMADLYLDADRVLNSYPHELSGGMKQRALIALSLVLEPRVLVMDEPTASLDLLMQRSILKLLRTIQEKYDLTLIFITHDLPLVAELADRLAVMYAFEFVEIGPTERILRHSAHPYTRALLNATPNLKMTVENMKPIEGRSPDPVDVPTGCSYHPRCPLGDETCEEHNPAFHVAEEDDQRESIMEDQERYDIHESACFYWDQAADAIESTVEEFVDSSDRGDEQ